MLIYKRIQQIRNLDDTLVFHLRQTLVHLQQIFSGGFLLRLEGTDFINKAFYFGFRIIIGNADLAKHDRAKVLVPYHDRHGHIYDTAMAQIDIGLLQTHCLKPGQGVTAVAAFAGDGVFTDHAAEIRPATVLGYGVAFEVDGDNGGSRQPCYLVLNSLPEGGCPVFFLNQILVWPCYLPLNKSLCCACPHRAFPRCIFTVCKGLSLSCKESDKGMPLCEFFAPRLFS